MKKPMKQQDGMYHIKGKKFPVLMGTRAQVHHGTAYKTPGGLTKDKLVQCSEKNLENTYSNLKNLGLNS